MSAQAEISLIQALEAEIEAAKGLRLSRSYERLYPWQRRFIRDTETHRVCGLQAANQVGKQQPNHCLVATPTGWRQIGDLRPGDQVLGGDGRPCNVLDIFPQGMKRNYRITFDDGASTLAGGEHLWKVMNPESRFRKGSPQYRQWEVVNTDHLIANYGMEPTQERRVAIPVCAAEFNEAKLPIEPYLLGVLIGDGSIKRSVEFTSADSEVVEHVRDATTGTVTAYGKYRQRITFNTSRTALGQFGNSNPITNGLRELGLLGCGSLTKFVPDVYKTASRSQRIALLQGLMDTDGTAGTNGCIEFSTISPALALDVQYLFRSLGMKCKIMERYTTYTHNGEKRLGQKSFRIRPRWNGIPVFRLQRKASRCFVPTSTTEHRLIYKIEDAGEFESTCIMVDSADHTYVTEDFIVTHNSLTGRVIDAMHLTGDYPDDWPGHRFESPPLCWLLGYSGEKTRDLLQSPLFGRMSAQSFDGGLIPADRILDSKSMGGTVGACREVRVKHRSGGISICQFWSYTQGQHALMGDVVDWYHIDEEPRDPEIFPQVLTRTLNGDQGRGGRGIITFTPENGRTSLVVQLMDDPAPGMCLHTATWDDAPHLDAEAKAQILASYPEYQREMRSKGIPLLGHGRIFEIGEEAITCDPMEPSPHWYVIHGMDFGYDHPQAHVRIYHDRDNDVIYLARAWKMSKCSASEAYGVVKGWGAAPTAWPHDGLQHEKGRDDAAQQKDHYARAGFRMLPEHATWPAINGQSGGISLEQGIYELQERMRTGRFKVFRGLVEFFNEFRQYHRENDKVVKVNDDILSALRYALMMRRYAVRVGDAGIVSPKAVMPRPIGSFGAVNSHTGGSHGIRVRS